MGFFLFLVLFCCLCIYWCYQFIQLMLLSESDFPGEHDKILWVVAFVFLFFLAPFAFHAWKTTYESMLSTQSKPPGKPAPPGSEAL